MQTLPAAPALRTMIEQAMLAAIPTEHRKARVAGELPAILDARTEQARTAFATMVAQAEREIEAEPTLAGGTAADAVSPRPCKRDRAGPGDGVPARG